MSKKSEKIKNIKQKIEEKSDSDKSHKFFALPVRDIVVFPQMTTTILIGRAKSVAAIKEAKRLNLPVLVVTQTNPDHDDFSNKTIYKVGVLCEVIEVASLPDSTVKAIVTGVARAKIVKAEESGKFFTCEAQVKKDDEFEFGQNKEILSLMKSNIGNFSQFSQYDKKISQDAIAAIKKIKSPYGLSNLLMSLLNSSIEKKQEVLQEDDVVKKLYKTLELIKIELEIAQTETKINQSIQEKLAKSQKNFYLLEQMRQIKKELGQDGGDEEGEVDSLRRKIKKLKLPEEAENKCENELKKLEKMNPYSSESAIVRNYLDLIIELPWHKKTKSNNDFEKSSDILDKSHFGLQKVKDRILEFIAVQMKSKNIKGPILCLVGAPGVGKTSLARSIANSLGRKYCKISLGGVRDESEIRGHRRTYIGSMPGRMIDSMRKSKVVNPLILLDEIDKMSYDLRGDPSSALLEVLDPEQNKNFSDHYLEVDYDLSQVMFVATANNISSVPAPLRDRMEIIRLSGYTENEKLDIAKKHLVDKQIKENGLKKSEISIDDSVILKIIRNYTFEAGVRNLEREIGKIARKSAKKIITSKDKKIVVNDKNIKDFLGVEKFRYGVAKDDDIVGVATGLAYTEYGGDLLDIETLKFEGGVGKIHITGRLGDVMKESASASLSYMKSIATDLGVDPKKFSKLDFHIHVPEGATPKDGPSAGVALCCSLASTITGKKIKKDIAMTGEITLTGRVLEIGGLKEKLLAALRGGIKTVLIPKRNEKDLVEIPEEVTRDLKIKLVDNVKEVLKEAIIGYDKSKNNKKSSVKKSRE